jgi:hypothetical protein
VVVDLMTEHPEPAHRVGVAGTAAERGRPPMALIRLLGQARNDSQLPMPGRVGVLVGASPRLASARNGVHDAGHRDGCRREHDAGEAEDHSDTDGDSRQSRKQQESPVQGRCPVADDMLGNAPPPVPGGGTPLEDRPDRCGGDGRSQRAW